MFLAEGEAGGGFDDVFEGELVEFLVALGAGALHGGAFGAVEDAELQASQVGDAAHLAAQSIDLAHEVAFADAADGRIATHLPDGVAVHGEECGFEAHARGGKSGFAARMAGADDDQVEVVGEGHG